MLLLKKYKAVIPGGEDWKDGGPINATLHQMSRRRTLYLTDCIPIQEFSDIDQKQESV